MFKGKKILALIPARGGSKGLPGKNKKALCGKPLIAWTIAAAKKSGYIDDIIVSTDDFYIAKIAKKYGARVPFMRPAKFATDAAPAIAVMINTREWLKKHKENYDIIVYLQPTSPLRVADDIDNGIKLFFEKNSNSVVSVCKSAKPKYLINNLPANGNMKNFLTSSNANKNRQQHKDTFEINGALYIAFFDYICSKKSWYGSKTFAYLMPRSRSIDIDTELDFRIAEFILENGLNK
jgi:N-acylneuraminate cytidylyltransferase/CMP-N,N'-diacetyllegionaminic acid synthase